MRYEAWGFRKNGGASAKIEKARFYEIKAAKTVCLFAVDLEEKLVLLLDNFAEFEFEMLRIAEASLIWPKRDHQGSMLERLTLDRRLVNLLTSCRLYLDQTDHGISGLFGDASQQLADVKKTKNELYDSYFGYRFMEALRNHVQHSGLPVHVIDYQRIRRKRDGPDYWDFIVVPESEISTLAENGKFKVPVLKELEKMGKKLDLRQPVREYVSCFIQLHEKLRETINSRLTVARSVYQDSLAEFSIRDGEEIQFPSLVECNEDGTTNEKIDLAGDFLGYYDALFMKNAANKNLQQSVASNSD